MSTVEVSVVIPSTGNPVHLEPCLQSLARQTLKSGVEVVVALDGETERYFERLDPLMARRDWPFSVRWIPPGSRRGTHAACNRGAAAAYGQSLIFLDDDMIAAPDLIAAHVRLLKENPDTVIVGAIKTQCLTGGGAYRYAIENFWNKRHQRLAHELSVRFDDCFSGNLAMSTELFRRFCGFDDYLAARGDLELGMRLERARVRMLYGASAGSVQLYDKGPSQRFWELQTQGLCGAKLWKKYGDIRDRSIFAVCRNGRRKYRWARRWALNSPIRLEALGFLLPYLPATGPTERLALLFEDLARARGARGEFGEDQWTAITDGTVFLCYHKFSPPGGERGPYTIPIDRFARQIKAMRRSGYRFIRMSDWIAARKRGELIGGRTAVITIDDGTDDVIDNALPFLRREDIPATLYVVSHWVGRSGYLSAAQLKSLAKDGFDVGSHSLSHPWLTRISEAHQREEIVSSRSELADLTGILAETFAYPYGDCDSTTERIAEEAGYAAALGVERGYSYIHSPGWTLPRFVIDGRWSMLHFRLVLASAIGLWGLI